MRAEMGLPPIEPSDMARFMEAAFDESPRPYALSKRATEIMASILSESCSVASRRAGGVSVMPLTASVSASLESFPCPVR